MVVLEIRLRPDDELMFLATPQVTCLEGTGLAWGMFGIVRLWGAVKLSPIRHFGRCGSSMCSSCNDFLLITREVFIQVFFLEVILGLIYNDETHGSCICCEETCQFTVPRELHGCNVDSIPFSSNTNSAGLISWRIFSHGAAVIGRES